MQAQSDRPVRTFTIGFHEQAFNEAEAAKAVARHLGTDHTELYVTPGEAQAVIPRLPRMYDEPFADSSQIPTFLVSQLARTRVTVALSGDGGDELFGGYVRYTWAELLWRSLSPLPHRARALVASSVRRARPEAVDRYFRVLERWLPERLRHRSPATKLRKLAEVLDARTPDDVYRYLVSTWREPGQIVRAPEPPLLGCSGLPIDDFVEQMMCADAVTYLPDDILVKLDRASMAVSLETRVPMLDPDVARFAWRIPREMKIRDGKGKWVLREVLARYVPRPMFERPKMGFAVPIDSWLRGPLRDWAEALLSEARLGREGYFDPKPIREKWREHLEGKRNWMDHLWLILMFQAWLEKGPSVTGA
jgi:asparagine synthase (glutamine-hydrolysing)